MSRLKFRAWDLYEKKFYYSNKGYQGHYVLSLDGTFTNLQNGAGGSEIVVQQYIGLKDINGNDIYEGDIVSFNDAQYSTVPVWGVAEVIFTTDLSLVDAPCYGLWFKTGFHKNMLGEIKVLGNIFETPELFDKPELYMKTESFIKAMQDIEEGKVVPLDRALTERPPSDELQKIFNDIEGMEAEKTAWKKMFDMQSKIVMGLELDKIRLENENKALKKDLELYKDIVRLSDHLKRERQK